jgi:hypothetical protein
LPTEHREPKSLFTRITADKHQSSALHNTLVDIQSEEPGRRSAFGC